MINNLLFAIDYNNYKENLSVVDYLRHFKLEDYSKVYFGRRFLTEIEHLVLVPHGQTADLPVYNDGVGYILLKDNTYIRTLTCNKCGTLCNNLEQFIIHENDSDYKCSNCLVDKVLWEEVKLK